MRDAIMKKEYDFSKGKRSAIIKQKGKSRITIYIDDDILEEFRRSGDDTGKGYQTLINDALKEYLGKSDQAINEKTLRRVIREELKKAG